MKLLGSSATLKPICSLEGHFLNMQAFERDCVNTFESSLRLHPILSRLNPKEWEDDDGLKPIETSYPTHRASTACRRVWMQSGHVQL